MGKLMICDACKDCKTSKSIGICLSDCSHPIDALEEFTKMKRKQEQGLLISLPVPIGTEVYKVVEDKTATTIETIKHNGREYSRTIPCYFVCRDLFAFSMLNEVGKTVFLTLDEARQAEEALAKMGGKQ